MRPRTSAQRVPIAKPRGMPPTYVCPKCDHVLWDGVDYSRCPACDRPVDWVDTTKPLWCCATCDALVNEERAEGDWPFCAACGRAMASVHATAPYDASTSVGRSLIAAANVAYVVCAFLQLVALAIDKFAFAMVAPIVGLLVLAAIAVLVTTLVGMRELVAVLRDRRTRVIHGLEHATLAVLDQRGHKTYEGLTQRGHFAIEVANGSQATAGAVRDALDEAIRRIRAGEHGCSDTYRCGTSLLVALLAVSLVIVGGGIAGLVAGLSVNIVAGLVALAIVLAWLAAQPLGLLAQRFMTVSNDYTTLRTGRIASR